jgi:hypothetical protein
MIDGPNRSRALQSSHPNGKNRTKMFAMTSRHPGEAERDSSGIAPGIFRNLFCHDLSDISKASDRRSGMPTHDEDWKAGAPEPLYPVKVVRNVYPLPEFRFKEARIGLSHSQSRPDYPPLPAAPEGSPNVLVVLLDDVGYGWLQAFAS